MSLTLAIRYVCLLNRRIFGKKLTMNTFVNSYLVSKYLCHWCHRLLEQATQEHSGREGLNCKRPVFCDFIRNSESKMIENLITEVSSLLFCPLFPKNIISFEICLVKSLRRMETTLSGLIDSECSFMTTSTVLEYASKPGCAQRQEFHKREIAKSFKHLLP